MPDRRAAKKFHLACCGACPAWFGRQVVGSALRPVPRPAPARRLHTSCGYFPQARQGVLDGVIEPDGGFMAANLGPVSAVAMWRTSARPAII